MHVSIVHQKEELLGAHAQNSHNFAVPARGLVSTRTTAAWLVSPLNGGVAHDV